MLPAQVPDIWGEGILFGFSGVDGETVTANGFVGSFGPEPYGILFHTPTKRQFEVRVEAPGRVLCATGDAVVVEVAGAELAYGWLQWHSLVGVCPPAVELALGFLGAAGEVAATADQSVVSTGQQAEEGTVALVRDQDRFALCYGHSPQEGSTGARPASSSTSPRRSSRGSAICTTSPVSTIPRSLACCERRLPSPRSTSSRRRASIGGAGRPPTACRTATCGCGTACSTRSCRIG